MKKTASVTNGFTLVELALTLGFLGFISLLIAGITNSMISTYQKGMILKQVNTVGSEVVEEIRSSIRDSAAKGINAICETAYSGGDDRTKCENTGASSLISTRYLAAANTIQIKNSSSKIASTISAQTPVYGTFCTGTYTYLWNSGYLLDKNSYSAGEPMIFSYYLSENSSEPQKKEVTNFRLLKIYDPSRSVCLAQNTSYGYSGVASNSKKISVEKALNVFQEDATEILSTANNSDLVLYDMEIFTASYNQTTGNIFYQGSFILGTMTGGINIMSTGGNFCAAPGDMAGEFFDYCAINKFNFASQAIGE